MGTAHAVLVLEDGRTFQGEALGAVGRCLGEVVFSTAMTGYQETLTDPSYRGQIVVQTAPQIGNTGWNDEDDESTRIQVSGYVVREASRTASSWRSRGGLPEELLRQRIVGIQGVDTRALTRHVRDRGAMRAGVFSGPQVADPATMVARVLAVPPMAGARLADAVTTPEPYVVPAVGEGRLRTVVLDLGAKAGITRRLAARGVTSHVLPATSSPEDLLALAPDGVLLSNGPGDPAAMDDVVSLVRALLAARVPVFGICFGHQILARALGRETYKMTYGHRGLNIPVVDAHGRVAITSQNHGFAVRGEAGERFATDFGPATVTHHCPNDGTVEGLACPDAPAFSVQYHPEAAAGPHDAEALFDRFVTLMEGVG